MFHIDRYRLLALLLFAAGTAAAQERPDTAGTPDFSLDAGCGYSFKTYLAEEIPYHGAGGGLVLGRANWRAASFFGFSVEAGWVTVAAEKREVLDPEKGVSKAAMRLDAFPATLQIFFTARWGELRAGIGVGLVRSAIEAWGERSGAERMSVAYLLSYGRPVALSSGMSLLPELGFFLIPDIDLLLFAPGVRLRVAL